MELSLGFLASNRGSNVEAILNKIETGGLEACAKVIISNNPNAAVLDLGEKKNIPNYCLNKYSSGDLNEAILKTLQEHDVNLVVLAGYMKKIENKIIGAYPRRILNIHPALLPKYGGKNMYGINVHKSVIDSNDIESGATIHLITEKYDCGEIIAQYKVPRYKLDTPKTLSERVLEIEHVLYLQTLKDIQKEMINLDK